MEKTGKRGKIPQTDWPLIMARYEQGETLSSIARTYDCSPPAISYIVSRSREKTGGDVAPVPATELQLVKAPANGAAGDDSAPVEPTLARPAAVIRHEPAIEPRAPTLTNGAPINGAPTSSTTANGVPASVDQRRKLHLSLGNSHSNGDAVQATGNGHSHSHEPPQRPSFTAPRTAQPLVSGNGQRPFQAPRSPPPFDAGRAGRDLFTLPEGRPTAQQPREADPPRKDSAAFIDQDLRSRVDGDIAAFLAAFDAALAADTQESRFGLREATDRLLRAGARTRIELERLEARVPLSPREGSAGGEAVAWRYR